MATAAGWLVSAACSPWTERVPGVDFAAARARMVERDLRGQGIRDERVLAAMGRVPREEFVRPTDRAQAYGDHALPIGHGQTISQPYIVARMTELLELRGGERVLDVGTGSGYQAAILAELVARVVSIEIEPALAKEAGERLARLGYRNVDVRAGDGFFGAEADAPFDAMVIAAVAPRVPEPLVAQLAEGGRIVMPLGEGEAQRLMRGRKRAGVLELEPVAEVMFVPMTGEIRRTRE